MNNGVFTWLTNCILFGSVVISSILVGELSQAQSARPNRPLDEPETAVANFHQSLQTAVQNSNIDLLNKHYCSFDRAVAEGIDPSNRSSKAVNAYLKMASMLKSYSLDTSGLYYETKHYDPEQGRAVVVIIGNVLLRTSTNRALVIPYRRFAILGRDWVRLIKENNQWVLCYNLTNPPK
jgi:hypothetical protein